MVEITSHINCRSFIFLGILFLFLGITVNSGLAGAGIILMIIGICGINKHTSKKA